ncbi:MAG: hypothetical protein HY006_01545 [Candidatus Sungbacteria bacterium]|nr:hypothetical protein [Candidatus Sungbacteria bacterium]
MLLLGKSQTNISVALDVGTHAIKGVIVRSDGLQGHTEILKRIVVQLTPAHDPVRVAKVLHNLLFDLTKNLGQIPSKVVIGFGPNLGEISLETWSVPMPESGKAAPLKDLSGSFTALFEKKRDTAHAWIAYPVHILVNGYVLPVQTSGDTLHAMFASLGSSVQDVSLRTVVSYFSADVGALLGALKELFGGVPIEFVPLVASYAETLIRQPETRHAFLIDIGSSNTSMLLIKEQEFVQYGSFPFGSRQGAERIEQVLGVSSAEAENLRRQYVHGLLNNSMKARIAEILAETDEVWKNEFIQGLTSFYHMGPLPVRVLLCGGGAYIPNIQSILSGQDWFRDYSQASVPEIVVLEGKAMFQESAPSGFLQGPEHAGIGSLVSHIIQHRAII